MGHGSFSVTLHTGLAIPCAPFGMCAIIMLPTYALRGGMEHLEPRSFSSASKLCHDVRTLRNLIFSQNSWAEWLCLLVAVPRDKQLLTPILLSPGI